MRKLLSLILAAVMLLSLNTALAQGYGSVAGEGSGQTCGDGLTWVLQGSTLYISGQGDMYDFPGGAPWAANKYSISHLVIGDGVTSIGAYAFQDYDYLSYVQFGNTLVSIGKEAFSSCDGLTALNLPATFKKFGESSFRSCINLHEFHCAGNFPRFDENSMWDTYATFYYPSSNPWPVSAIQQLETAFHGRIEFRASDGTDPYNPIYDTVLPAEAPTEAVTEEMYYPTQPVYIPQEIFTRPTEATVPVQTEAPVYTPEPLPTAPVQTDPVQTAPVSTEAPFLMGTQPTQAAEPAPSVTNSTVIGLLIIVLTLTVIATAALIFRLTYRHGKRGRY